MNTVESVQILHTGKNLCKQISDKIRSSAAVLDHIEISPNFIAILNYFTGHTNTENVVNIFNWFHTCV